jgi:hypothetical protein
MVMTRGIDHACPRAFLTTRCLEGTFGRSVQGARCRLTCSLAAHVVAGCGLRWPNVCRRWLPTRLPVELFCLYRGLRQRPRSR